MCQAILIKPHHFVDIMRALGSGNVDWKPHSYGHNLHGVAARLVADCRATLQIELGADDICQPCIHNADGQCDDVIDTSFRPQAPRSKQEWNLLIDRRWCERLGIDQGDTFTARELCERIRDLGGDLTRIYREIPADRTAHRQECLEKGIGRFLGE